MCECVCASICLLSIARNANKNDNKRDTIFLAQFEVVYCVQSSPHSAIWGGVHGTVAVRVLWQRTRLLVCPVVLPRAQHSSKTITWGYYAMCNAGRA